MSGWCIIPIEETWFPYFLFDIIPSVNDDIGAQHTHPLFHKVIYLYFQDY